jgi:hypothetical protein
MNKNMINETTIERTVMRRVRLIRILALIISIATLAVLTTLAALWGIGREVWVARVFENMPPPGDTGTFISFWFSAFLQTHFLVQVLTILTFISVFFLGRELARFTTSFFTSGRASSAEL